MEQKFSNNGLDLKELREFCEREGELVEYRKGDQMEREGDPSRWFGYVTGWLLRVCETHWHQRRQGTYHVVFVRGRVCGRLSQLPRRASCPDHYRGDMPSRMLREREQLMELFR